MKSRIVIAGLLMTILVSGTNLAGRAAALEINPWALVFFRYVIAMITIRIMLALRGRKIRIDWRDWKSLTLLTLSGILLNQIFFVWGLKFTVPSHPSLLYATTSFWIMLLRYAVQKEVPTRKFVLSAGLAAAGVLFVFGKNLLVFNADILRGDSILLAAVLSWAVYTAFGQEMVRKYGALQLTYILLGLGSAVYMIPGILSIASLHPEHISLTAWGGVLYMGVFTSALSYVLYYFMLKHLAPQKLALLIAAQPPMTLLLSILAGYETFQASLIVGIILIIAAIVLSTETIKIKGKKRWAA